MDGITMESILTSIKKMLGPTAEYTHFDPDIIMHINSVFVILKQMGVGPAKGFFIEDATTTWGDFIEDPVECNAVKTYMYAKVRKVFDPPSNSVIMKALDDTINEFEWRLNFDAESK